MKRITGKIAILLLLLLIAVSSNCIFEEKVIELVLTDETCANFEQDEDSATFVEPDTLDYADEIDAVLADNELSRADIISANLVSASYGVTEFSHDHDWIISGTITVERFDIVDGPEIIVNYSSQSVAGALGIMIPADLNAAGVELMNRALVDYIGGQDPVLIFKVNNGSVGVDPPNPDDRMIFEWQACIVMHILTTLEVDVPDPF